MYFNVAQLLKEPIGSSRHHQIDDIFGKEGINYIEGEVTLTRINRGIIAMGKMVADVSMPCSRCLNTANYQVSFDLADEFIPKPDTHGYSSLAEDNDSFIIDHNNILDMSVAIRQSGLLAIPIKPLCSPDCAGICPSCGRDLNQDPCECSSQVYVNACRV